MPEKTSNISNSNASPRGATSSVPQYPREHDWDVKDQDECDLAGTLAWYRRAADQGDARAQIHLGFIYQQGHGVPQDYAEAVKWYRLAVAQGQYHLGIKNAKGYGVSQDHGEAARWYRLAAERGHAKAQVCLGSMYSKGIGVLTDHVEAVKWYNLAAVQGDTIAQFNLGVSYVKGHGVEKDFRQAHRWFSIGADGGDARARETRDAVARRLLSSQEHETQKLVPEPDTNKI